MTSLDTSVDHDEYNRLAIETAERLTAARRAAAGAAGQRPGGDRPLERLLPPHSRAPIGVFREYAAMGNQPVSDGLAAQAEAMGVELEHLAITLGTVIHGVDLRRPDDELVAFVRATLAERKVVFFRDQHLSEDEQVAFGRRFGALDAFPFGPPGENPYILEIRHGEQSPGTENGWHTDVTWMERPSMGSIAQMILAPPIGGDTLFADSHAAFHGLPDDLVKRLRSVEGINDYRNFVAGFRGQHDSDLVDDIKGKIPFGVSHPLLRTHPETGKTALYIHGGFLRHDSLHDVETGEPLDPDESRSIVKTLLAQHANPEYHCRFSWAEGSIAFWDNRAVQHYAASDYFPHRRTLRRVTVAGDRPYYDPT